MRTYNSGLNVCGKIEVLYPFSGRERRPKANYCPPGLERARECMNHLNILGGVLSIRTEQFLGLLKRLVHRQKRCVWGWSLLLGKQTWIRSTQRKCEERGVGWFSSLTKKNNVCRRHSLTNIEKEIKKSCYCKELLKYFFFGHSRTFSNPHKYRIYENTKYCVCREPVSASPSPRIDF